MELNMSILLDYVCRVKSAIGELYELRDCTDPKLPLADMSIFRAMAIYRHATTPEFLMQAAYRVGFESGRGI